MSMDKTGYPTRLATLSQYPNFEMLVQGADEILLAIYKRFPPLTVPRDDQFIIGEADPAVGGGAGADASLHKIGFGHGLVIAICILEIGQRQRGHGRVEGILVVPFVGFEKSLQHPPIIQTHKAIA